MSRLVSGGQVIYDQLDFYNAPGSIVRLPGISYTSLSVKVFANNVNLAWSLADGSTVLDSSISAGTVYFNEITGNAGYYQFRFFPDRVGFWRILFVYTSGNTELIREYDILAAGTLQPGPNTRGLVPSFEVSGNTC